MALPTSLKKKGVSIDGTSLPPVETTLPTPSETKLVQEPKRSVTTASRKESRFTSSSKSESPALPVPRPSTKPERVAPPGSKLYTHKVESTGGGCGKQVVFERPHSCFGAPCAELYCPECNWILMDLHLEEAQEYRVDRLIKDGRMTRPAALELLRLQELTIRQARG